MYSVLPAVWESAWVRKRHMQCCLVPCNKPRYNRNLRSVSGEESHAGSWALRAFVEHTGAQVLPIVLISRHLQYTGATQADWNAGGVSGLSCDVICVSFFFVFPAPFAGARQFRNSISLKPERMMRCQHIVMKIVPSFRKIDIYGHVKNKKKELHSPVKNKVPRVNEQTGWPPLAQITLSNCFLYDILSLMSLWGNFSPLFFKVLLQFIEVWGHLFMHKCLTSQTWVWLRSGLWLRHL